MPYDDFNDLLQNMDDVDISGRQDGDAIIWNETDQKYVSQPIFAHHS